MWFRMLSLVVATVLLGKAAVALAFPRRFYAVREGQYASDSVPAAVMAVVAVMVAITLTAWYAIFFHPHPWGWLLTGFLTAVSGVALYHLFRWKTYRLAMLEPVRSSRVVWVDCLLLVAAAGFIGLALLVY